jgi:hypothetical protein
MEMYGIIFSVPMAFICGIIYAVIIGKVIAKWNELMTPLLWISGVLFALLLLEIISVIVIGTLKLRAIIGPEYYPIHSLLFFLTLPSLVNIMKIQKSIPLLSKWYFIGTACAIIGLVIVILQYGVSEALYGITGTNGPYNGP